ncbi:MAG: hypothetical protein J6T10_22725 [Methanobrevibacter sp.]|nr:hypothetical protein [Methanobrevibacter sp.]
MAERSGFFQAQWDDNLQNPITQEYTGWWDRDYIYKEFLDYFSLFVGNGVFGSPTNQLKVIPGNGLSVIVSAGWAFINGAWYHNDSDKEITLPLNGTSTSRVDSIKVRYVASNRGITAVSDTGSTSVTRTSSIYELKLAEVIVPTSATEIVGSNITDTRMNESVCGLVKGLLEVETTEDLFAQYQSAFNEWFDDVKDQATGDLAVRLQLEFDELNNKVEQYEDDVEEQVGIAQGLVSDYVNNDYVIPEQEFVFLNKVCTISDSKVKATSLIDVYFTAATIDEAEDCQIIVDSTAGSIILTAIKQPTNTIRGYIRVRVN